MGISSGRAAGKTDLRISVAPMMDWTDDHEIVCCINSLALPERACLLYVSSIAQLIRNSNALPAGTRLSGTRHRDEASKLQRLDVERPRGLAAQPSIAGVDQTVRKVGYRVLP